MSQVEKEVNEPVDPDRLRAVSIEDFEIREYSLPASFYIPCKLYTVYFKDAEKRRYLVSWDGRYVITKEVEGIGFWVDDCASYKCLSNVYMNGKWVNRDGRFVIRADKKDINFVNWVREKL